MISSLVSVVVPAYNAEANLEATLQSIIAQDYANMEIIVVNDASTDKTGELAKKILSSSSGCKWRVIDHEQNKGECGARNTGLVVAKGEYIVFIDADDFVDVNFVSSLYKIAVEVDADISFCGYRRLENTGEVLNCPINLLHDKNYPAESLAEMYIFDVVHPVICSMMFKISFLMDFHLKFYEGCLIGGDIEFAMKALGVSSKTVFLSECLYVYRIHEGMISKTSKATREKEIQAVIYVFQAKLRAADYLQEHSPSLRIKEIARCFLRPTFSRKMFKVYALQGDKKAFMDYLRMPGMRYSLLASYRFFVVDPTLLFKCVFLVLFPQLYFCIYKLYKHEKI